MFNFKFNFLSRGQLESINLDRIILNVPILSEEAVPLSLFARNKISHLSKVIIMIFKTITTTNLSSNFVRNIMIWAKSNQMLCFARLLLVSGKV